MLNCSKPKAQHSNPLVDESSIRYILRLGIHEPLRQRIVMNFQLDGLSKKEGRMYISEKLKDADCSQPVFEDAAVETVLNDADIISRQTE